MKNFAATSLLATLACALVATGAESTDLYYLVFLRPTADRKPLAKEQAQTIQDAHLNHVRSMAARGILVAAGPFGDTVRTISGIFVMKAASLEEARRIAAEDPTVIEHRNSVDAYAWRGPKGIGDEYRRLHAADPKTPEDMGVQPFVMLYRGGADEAAVERAHQAYLDRLRRDGKLAAYGTIEGDRDLRAIAIFNRIEVEDAAKLMESDPAVMAGALRAETHHWWCSAHVLPEAAARP